jgi:RNA polymerase sigma-32 factor
MTSQPSNLNAAAFALLQALASAELRPGGRARATVDAAIRALHALLRPRMRALIRHHGLADHSEDAEQACLIALVDAVRRWDPARSNFGTWLGWRWRAALSQFSRQMRGDSRTAAGQRRRALAVTDDDAIATLADPVAELAAMRGAADWLVGRCADRLLAAGDDGQLDVQQRRTLAELAAPTLH